MSDRYTPLIDDDELPCVYRTPVSAFKAPITKHQRGTMHTTTLFRCELVTKGPGRCVGGGNEVLMVLPSLDSVKEGRLGDERVGLIEEGGVMEA